MKWPHQNGPSAFRNYCIIAVALMLGLTQTSVWAAGTASGTDISNLAKLAYTVGGVAQGDICSSPTGNTTSNGGTGGTSTCAANANGAINTTFKVDNKINLTVAVVDATPGVNAVPGQVAATPLPNPPAYLTFTVTNNGNTTQDFKLSTTNPASPATDPFSATPTAFNTSGCRIFLESGGAATTLQIGTDTEVSYIDNLIADAVQRVYLVCNVPITATNGQTGVAGLIAEAVDTAGSSGAPSASYTAAQLTAANTQNGVEIVAADIAGSEGDIARDAKHSARDTYKIVSAVLSVSKSYAPICDPFNGPSSSNSKNIPGAAVQYAITISNTGGAAASLTTVTDTLVGALLFDPKLNSGAAPATNCVSGNATNQLSATGFGAITGNNPSTYAAPGLAAQAVTAGATAAGQAITIDYQALAGGGLAGWTGGSLGANKFITVYFNAFVQ